MARFFAEGAARDERLMLVVDDPVREHWPTQLLERGALLLVSVGETYGSDRIVDPVDQRRVFASCLDEARAEGFSGLRVAADNTSLVGTPERLRSWLAWEAVADRFLAENPVTGLCAFDRRRLERDTIDEVIGVHRVVHPEARTV